MSGFCDDLATVVAAALVAHAVRDVLGATLTAGGNRRARHLPMCLAPASTGSRHLLLWDGHLESLVSSVSGREEIAQHGER